MTAVDPDLPFVQRAQAGDFSAFEELVDRHQGRLYTMVRRMLRDEDDAQEVVQEAFLSAIEKIQDFRGEAPFAGWLTRIAANHALKVLRKKRGLPTEPYVEEPGEDEPVQRPSFVAPWGDSPEHLLAL